MHWTAPEIMVNKRYQFPADVYSFGMVLYEMAVGRIPFHNMIPMGVMMAVAIQKQRPPMTPGVDPKLADLIERCTRWEPEERPCVGAVLQSLLDLLPLVERTKGHASSAQLELNHTNRSELGLGKVDKYDLGKRDRELGLGKGVDRELGLGRGWNGD